MLREITLDETGLAGLAIEGRLPCGPAEYPPDDAPRDPLLSLVFRDISKAHAYIAEGVSMVGFGVNPGDTILSEEDVQPNPNDHVIVEVPGEGKMLKKFCPPYLIGDNGRTKEIIHPREGAKIKEVVRAIMHIKHGR